MCLAKITKSYEGRGIGPIIAFKKFKMINGNIHNFYRPTERHPWEINKERSAGPKSIKIRVGYRASLGFYPAGFHAYTIKRPAYLGIDGVWAKVRLRGVQTKGKQGGKTVYVARYCKILKIFER